MATKKNKVKEHSLLALEGYDHGLDLSKKADYITLCTDEPSLHTRLPEKGFAALLLHQGDLPEEQKFAQYLTGLGINVPVIFFSHAPNNRHEAALREAGYRGCMRTCQVPEVKTLLAVYENTWDMSLFCITDQDIILQTLMTFQHICWFIDMKLPPEEAASKIEQLSIAREPYIATLAHHMRQWLLAADEPSRARADLETVNSCRSLLARMAGGKAYSALSQFHVLYQAIRDKQAWLPVLTALRDHLLPPPIS